MVLAPTSRVLRMSIINFLMVSNSCGLTLRELSIRKTRSTGPDLHFCSGPGRNQKDPFEYHKKGDVSVAGMQNFVDNQMLKCKLVLFQNLNTEPSQPTDFLLVWIQEQGERIS